MTIEIEIKVQAAALVLTQSSGNFRAGAGSEVVWSTNDPNREFRLDFFNLQVGGKESPFTNGVIHARVSRDKPFRAQLQECFPKGEVGAFKYSVSASGLVLDPVIIMAEE